MEVKIINAYVLNIAVKIYNKVIQANITSKNVNNKVFTLVYKYILENNNNF